MYGPVFLATVVPDEDGQRSDDDEGQVPVPSRSHTPPTPPVQAASPPACSRPLRQRAMAQLRPVSIPEIVGGYDGSMGGMMPWITANPSGERWQVGQLPHSLCSA